MLCEYTMCLQSSSLGADVKGNLLSADVSEDVAYVAKTTEASRQQHLCALWPLTWNSFRHSALPS